MRLIDADALYEKLSKKFDCKSFMISHTDIFDAPIVDPVKHSRWVKMTGMMPPEYMGKHCCLECSALAPHDFGRERLTDWCPTCGAKMDLPMQ